MSIVSRLSAPHALAGTWKVAMKFIHGSRPVPLDKLHTVRRILGGVDPLYPRFQRTPVESALSNKELAARISGVRFDSWSLSPQSLNLVERHISDHRPMFVLEFGSGVSTACLAWYMRSIHGPDGFYVLSVDQEERFVESTSSLLVALGLEGYASVTYAPLGEQVIGGRTTRCYDLSEDLLQERKADMLLIDGPAGEPGVRFGTLPLALPSLNKGATFFLDDAFRDAEIDIATEWSLLPRVKVDGVALVGTGLLIGQVDS